MASFASRLVYDGAHWSPVTDVAFADIYTAPLDQRSRVEIYFLPEVKSFETQNQDLQRGLSDIFAIPDFFWARAGWDANGFYQHSGFPGIDFDGPSYSTTSRFLLKEISLKPNGTGYEYEWQFFAFASVWYKPKPSAPNAASDPPTQLLLCFDLSTKIKNEIIKQFKAKPPTEWLKCPYGVYSVLAKVIVLCADSALWGYRQPIRAIEQSRPLIDNANKLDRGSMQKRYLNMHELSRHTIHITEVLGATAGTLRAISQNHNVHCVAASADSCNHNAAREIELYQRFLENLQLRANAFDKRLQTEITLSYNLYAADDNATAKDILSDGKQLTNLVSSLTILFLPATFFSGFFGMNFFSYSDDGVLLSRSLWLFFVFTVPVTLFAWVLRAHFRHKSSGRRWLTLEARKRLPWSASKGSDSPQTTGNGSIPFASWNRQDTFPALSI